MTSLKDHQLGGALRERAFSSLTRSVAHRREHTFYWVRSVAQVIPMLGREV